jgi:DNA-binding NtrC family response regulator
MARILLVTGDRTFRDCGAAILCSAGFRAESACDAEEAWETLGQHGYELVVVEQELPGISGLRLVLRMSRSSLTLPVILITASPENFAPPSHRLLRLTNVVPKPLEGDRLLEIVAGALNNSEPAKRRHRFVQALLEP